MCNKSENLAKMLLSFVFPLPYSMSESSLASTLHHSRHRFGETLEVWGGGAVDWTEGTLQFESEPKLG